MTNALGIPAFSALLTERIGDFARDLTGGDPTSRHGDQWRFRAKGSLAVKVFGPNRGAWYDFEAGASGGPLWLVAHLRREPMRAAYAWALAWSGSSPHRKRLLGLPPHVAPFPPPSETSAMLHLARSLWREAVSADALGSLVPLYLAGRGLSRWDHAPLRFHPYCPRGSERLPAMLALMTKPMIGEPCGVPHTFLRADGFVKAEGATKMMLGRAGVVRLTPNDDLTPNDEVTQGVGLAEGIETGLGMMQRAGWRPVWVATSAGGIARFRLKAVSIVPPPGGAHLIPDAPPGVVIQ